MRGRKSLLALLAIAAVAAAGFAVRTVQRRTNISPIQRLVAAMPAEARVVEARISGGFPWAPLARERRDTTAASTRLRAAAARVLAENPENREIHAVAVAHLLRDDTAAALKTLALAAASSRSPAVWNDLGAAHYHAALRSGAPDELARALGATDQALVFDSQFRESLFNRALILERFHLRDAAIAAWRVFLATDDDERWRSEAQQHLDALLQPPVLVASQIETQYGRLETGDTKAARGLLEIDAGDARYFGETEGLARWGEAWLARDRARAGRHRIAMRTLGAALTAFNGDSLLQDAVAAIGSADDASRDSLARGHVAFRDGRLVYKQRKAAEGEKLLIRAQRELERGGSPLAREVEFFVAVAAFDQGRHAEAEQGFRTLAKRIPAQYAALRGYLDWQLASCAMIRNDTGATTTHLLNAIAAFTRLGEANNAAYLHDITSQVYDDAGDWQRAARHRMLALRELGKTANYRLAHAVSGIIDTAMQRKEWRVARSFLNVQLAINGHPPDPEIQTDTLVRRAILHSHLGDRAAADADLRAATGVVASVTDPSLRVKLQMDRDAGAALLSDDPRTAISLLTEALRFHEEKGWRRRMPDLYLQRGRMQARLGDRKRAAADYEAGIVMMERHRETIEQGEQRWGVLDAGEELFDEAIAEALRDGAEQALAYAERKRGRSLSDSDPDGGQPFDPASLPPGTVLVEYAALPEKLLVFRCDRGGCDVRPVPVSRAHLALLRTQFMEALRRGDPKERERAGTELASFLVAPVQPALRARSEVVFVPDASTSAVAFAALPTGSGRMIIEDFTVSVAPSARVYQRARTRRRRAPSTVLVIDSPAHETLEVLHASSTEARAVGSAYVRAERLSGTKATPRALREEARSADVIHFAGHGVTSSEDAALMLASSDGRSGRLDAAAISRLDLPRTEIVVLAACDTARGPVRAAEGTLSVAHAFLQAGAPSVIATLWAIDDRQAARFFPAVHRHLARGVSPPEALRLVQLEWIRSTEDNSAALWAAVQSVGY